MLRILVLSFFIVGTIGQRRILNGSYIGEIDSKRYMVHLVKAAISPQAYLGWICGGALVTSEYIITSAACVEDVKHLYAIAGSKKYTADIYNDECTKFTKKKIIYTCIPQSYNLDYERLEKWSYIDIAVVKVESPYDFRVPDSEYKSHKCYYSPRPIRVNYEDKFQEPGIDAIALGWGHIKKWRKDGDLNNYNQANLRYSSVLIANKEDCKKHYEDYEGMNTVIDNYMICSIEEGNINAHGVLKKKSPLVLGCGNSTKPNEAPSRLLALEGLSCEDGTSAADIVFVENTRKSVKLNVNNVADTVEDNKTIVETFKKYNNTNMTELIQQIKNTRRHGICQNDHGGPLVTWVGSHEVLIGVASVFKVDNRFRCIGPFLYTSTQCSGAFLDCILSSGYTTESRKAFCDAPPEVKGFHSLETSISWWDHPDGPAENEKYLVRPLHSQHGI